MCGGSIHAEPRYANLFFEILNKLFHKVPVAFYPGCDNMHLDFSEFESAEKDKKYEIYKDIMENDALLIDVNYTNRVLMRINTEKFFFITCEKYARVEKNINEIGTTLFTFFRKYEYALMKALPKSDLVDQVLEGFKDVETKKINVYGPCALIPYQLLKF